MNDKNIEEFLRNSRPAVKDDMTFILETCRRLESVEGIKEEVDRQRRHGRSVVLVALFLGLFAGIIIMAIAFLFPEMAALLKTISHDIITAIPDAWKMLLISVSILAVSLGLAVSLNRT